MSGSLEAVQAALVAALRAGLDDCPVFDGPPPRAAFPYAAIGDAVSADWSCKTARGREHRLAIVLWDDPGADAAPARLHGLMAAAETAIETIPRDLSGWRIASLVFLRARTVRDPAGPWAGLIEYRVRVMAV